MPSHLDDRRLFCSDVVQINDVCCHAARGERSPAAERPAGYEVVFPRRGLFLRHVGSSVYVGDPTQVLLCNPTDEHRVSHPVAGGDDCTALTFPQHLICAALAGVRRGGAGEVFPVAAVNAAPRMHLLIARLRRLALADSTDRLTIEETALTLLTGLAGACAERNADRRTRRPVRTVTARAHADLAAAVRELLAANTTRNLSLAEIARAVHASAYHLARVFRAQTGLSIHQYRDRLRMAAAAARLADGRGDDLTALALDLGYSSHAHFAAAFSGAFGLAPSHLRDGRIHPMN